MTTIKRLATTVAFVLAGTVAAQTLDDARAAIRKGTAPGITVIPARSKAASSPQATASAAAPVTAAGTKAPSVVPPAPASSAPAKRDGGFLSTLPPPSGQPMSATKRLNAPDLGIPVRASAPGGR